MKRIYPLKKFIFLITTLLVAGCATTNVGSSYSLSGKTNEGLAVASLSHEGLNKGENPEWFYRRVGSNEQNTILLGTLRSPLDWESPPGKLIYIALPPGKYEFYRCGLTRTTSGGSSWHVGAGGVVTNSNPYYAGFDSARYPAGSLDAEPFSIQFEIVPGKTTYIGNLHFIWRGPLQKTEVQTIDRSDRDLPLLYQRLPNLKPTETRKEITPAAGGR